MPDNKVAQTKNKTILSHVSDEVSLVEKAMNLQAKAAEFGFDWPTIAPIFETLQEDIDAFKFALRQFPLKDYKNNHHRLQDELGDVIFCCMNLARFLKVDPEKALQSTNEKFERRFNFIENNVAQQGKKMQDLTLEELDQVWDLAKEQGL